MERVNYIQSHKKHTDSKTMERVNHIQSHKLGNIYGIKGHGKGKLYSKSDETCRYIDRQTYKQFFALLKFPSDSQEFYEWIKLRLHQQLEGISAK